MNTAARAGPTNNVAVTILGLVTLLLGGAYATLGGQLIWAGASWAWRAEGDPWGPVASLFGIGRVLVIAVGVAFLPLGLLGLLAGLGCLRRDPWGRDFALGAAQVVYGIVALVIVIKEGPEFSRPRVRTNQTGMGPATEPW